MFKVYILYSCKIDRYYIGYTSNLEERIRKHNQKHKKGVTQKSNDWIVVYSENFKDKASAMKREKQIKSWKSRKIIESLISEKEV